MTLQDGIKLAGEILVVLSTVNGLMKDSPAKHWLGEIINFLSFLTRSTADGTFKAPLTRGPQPRKDNVVKLNSVVALFLIGTLGLAACAKCDLPANHNSVECKAYRAVSQCGPGAAAAVLGVLPQLIAGDIDGALAAIMAKVPGEYSCIVAALQEAAFLKYGPASSQYKKLTAAVKRVEAHRVK